MISCTRGQVLNMDFESSNSNKYEQVILDQKWTIKNPGQGLSNGPALQVNYIGSKIGSERVLGDFLFKKPLNEATLSFYVKFEEDFDFVKGGKMHGLAPVRQVSGGNEMRPDGWSARMLFGGTGKLAAYLYHQNKKTPYGEAYWSAEPVLTPGKFNLVEFYLKMNTPASASNGSVEIWVDNKKIIQVNDLQFRGVEGDSTLINKFLFSTFHGGHTPEYAPKDSLGNYRNLKAWYDNIKISQGKSRESKSID